MNVTPLLDLLGVDRCLTRRDDCLAYSFDATASFLQQPAAVVFPETADEVVSILRWATEHQVAVVTRGSGTGLSGGSLPVPGKCLVLCTVRMNRILKLDAQNLALQTQCGVITQQIADTSAHEGLFYPPDPGSLKISTIGGNVAENSGGLRGLKYGVTKDYVLGLQVVLMNGTLLSLGNACVKDVAGYSLKDLFIGSEGTLGVITEILLKLIPTPASKKTLLAVFDRMTSAAETVSAIIAAKITPCTLEFLDRVTINCIEDYMPTGLPRDAEAVLLMETDGHPQATAEEANQMAEIARQHGARDVRMASSSEEALSLTTARRSAFSALARVKPTTILEDATVPRSELAKMIEFIQQVGQRHRLQIGTFGHMGDGNLHPTFLTNEKDIEEMARVEKAMEEIFSFAVSIGGTITGEHGVGLAKKKIYKELTPPATLEAMKSLKRAFDPQNLLNPGKIFDL